MKRAFNSLMVRLRLIFILLLVLMGILLAYQINTAARLLSHEVGEQQKALARTLNTWLMDEARYHMALVKGVQPYKQLLASRLVASQKERVQAVVRQLHQGLPFSGVMLISDSGEGWDHGGHYYAQLSWPDWLKDQPLKHISLRLVDHEGLPAGWKKLFPFDGLYSIVKVPIYFAVGEEAGLLVLVRQLAIVNQRVSYLSNIMQEVWVGLALQPPHEVSLLASPRQLLFYVMNHPVLRIWVPMPPFVRSGEGAGFVWHQPTTFFQEVVRGALMSVLLPFAIFFIALAGLFWYLSTQVVQPLQKLAQLFKRLREGRRGERMPAGRYAEEVAYVVEQTNHMLDRLDERERALQALNNSLEQQVKQRTYQLEKANQRLGELAYLDPLTGVNNRLRFEQRWRDLQPHEGLVLALVDVD
ncbi:MAG TPA: hypothetical protein EYP05_04305, partial [Piscirickettsiaceae bacterium]|nr:hypothetical protein [Piscirickettsiaceae bacterium]